MLHNVYESGRTLRYHANPQMARFGQTVADHSWGVAAIVLALHPKPSLELIKACIFHDSGERWVGDLPYPFKRMSPSFAVEHERLEHQAMSENGIPLSVLTEDEKKWLKFGDRLEAYLYCRIHNPELARSKPWQDNNNVMYQTAVELGIVPKVEAILNDKINFAA